jgi:hypothetical protein
MSDAKPKPRSRKRKRRRASVRNEYVRYIVAIETWDWSYSFGLAGLKDSLDPYMEHRHVKITGKLLRPVDSKVTAVGLHLLPRHDLDHHERKDSSPLAIGSLSLRDGTLTGLLGMPKAALPPILQMLITGRFKLVDIGSARMRYREAPVRSFSMETHIDEDDMPSAGDESERRPR